MNLFGLKIPKGILFLFVCANTVSGCSFASLQEPFTAMKDPKETERKETVSGLQRSDRRLADDNLQAALENSLSGKPLRWQNPSSGASGSVTPLKTWKNDQGEFCRSYSENYRLASGQSVNRKGVACRMPNAVWKTA